MEKGTPISNSDHVGKSSFLLIMRLGHPAINQLTVFEAEVAKYG